MGPMMSAVAVAILVGFIFTVGYVVGYTEVKSKKRK